MPPIGQHHKYTSTKMLLIGDSGVGKTGALASLAAVGYNLRIIDFDNGLSSLVEYATNPKSLYVTGSPTFPVRPGIADRISYVTCTDTMKTVAGRMYPTKAKAWTAATKLLENWVDGDQKLGPITSWSPQDILVIDSLTKASDAALTQHLQMNNALGQVRDGYTGQRDVGEAQKLIRSLLELLYDQAVPCNVIVLSHVTTVNEKGLGPSRDAAVAQSETLSGYPSAIGKALSPQIPRYFDTMLIARLTGSGSAVRRQIFTTPQNVAGQVISAKNAAPLTVKASYPLETGLAEYFRDVRGGATAPEDISNVTA